MNDKRAWVFERCDRVALWEGLDDALVGLVTRCGQADPIAVYERNAIIRLLSKDMPFDDAVEWIDVNINGAYIGEHTPFLLEVAPRVKRRRPEKKFVVVEASQEVQRLRAALQQIAENKDEPYARDFAADILARRETP